MNHAFLPSIHISCCKDITIYRNIGQNDRQTINKTAFCKLHITKAQQNDISNVPFFAVFCIFVQIRSFLS